MPSFFILDFALTSVWLLPTSLQPVTSAASQSTKNISSPGWNSTQARFAKSAVGGKQVILTRHHDAQQYNPLHFDTEKAIVFPGTSTDSRLAAWLELMLIQLAFSLGIGVNKNRDSPYMANLPGEDYSDTNLGSAYLVIPVHTTIHHHNTRRLLRSACKRLQ
jgi:hypothetical protein